MSATPSTPTPAERVKAAKTMSGSPRELREAAVELLVTLSGERHSLRQRQRAMKAQIGELAYKLAELGQTYDHTATETGIDRSSVYRSASDVGTVVVGSRTPKPGEIARLVKKLAGLVPEREEIKAGLVANSEALGELVRWVHFEHGMTLVDIEKISGLTRSPTLYIWIRPGPDPAPTKSRRKGKPSA